MKPTLVEDLESRWFLSAAPAWHTAPPPLRVPAMSSEAGHVALRRVAPPRITFMLIVVNVPAQVLPPAPASAPDPSPRSLGVQTAAPLVVPSPALPAAPSHSVKQELLASATDAQATPTPRALTATAPARVAGVFSTQLVGRLVNLVSPVGETTSISAFANASVEIAQAVVPALPQFTEQALAVAPQTFRFAVINWLGAFADGWDDFALTSALQPPATARPTAAWWVTGAVAVADAALVYWYLGQRKWRKKATHVAARRS